MSDIRRILNRHSGAFDYVDTPKGRRIRCVLTGHEMPESLETVSANDVAQDVFHVERI